jgi:hypothetical protein
MSEVLQEFVDSGSERLRVDRAAGTIRGVKLLGLTSRNGRSYREQALIDAVGLYEGAKVNINHPKGHPLAPRDYQDRLGVVRGVEFRPGLGLFGDLHFNPKHALSEQLVWDAEHAPQNVGMSHNVVARTARNGPDTVVEAITKVQSIDLVADPATTSGLYEQAEARAVVQQSSSAAASESTMLAATLASVTLEELRQHRPDLLREAQAAQASELEHLRSQLAAMLARQSAAKRRERILELLQEHDLPLPTAAGIADSQLVSPEFIDQLMQAANDQAVRQLIEQRAQLVRSAAAWTSKRRSAERPPQSRDQLALLPGSQFNNSKEFAAAIRRN